MPVGTSGVDQRGNCVDDVPLPNAFTVAPKIVDNIPRPRDTAQWIVGFCTPTECFERIWAHLSYSPFNDSTYERALKGKSERQNLGISGSLAKNLLRCWCLRGLKDLPCIPSALPILFLGPTLRF